VSDRHYPGEPRFATIRIIAKVYARRLRRSLQLRHPLLHLVRARDIERIAAATHGHWGVHSMHWLLDVEFKDDLSRYRTGHGAKNMAGGRRFALGLVRSNKSNTPQKSRPGPRLPPQTPANPMTVNLDSVLWLALAERRCFKRWVS
jgi:hypothetical protein